MCRERRVGQVDDRQANEDHSSERVLEGRDDAVPVNNPQECVSSFLHPSPALRDVLTAVMNSQTSSTRRRDWYWHYGGSRWKRLRRSTGFVSFPLSSVSPLSCSHASP